jgi:hypothetical protein
VVGAGCATEARWPLPRSDNKCQEPTTPLIVNCRSN